MEIRVLGSFLHHENCQDVFSKTCINFGRCYGNQRWAEAVENKLLFLKGVKTLTMVSMETKVVSEDILLDKLSENLR